MKKFFTLITAALIALSAAAIDYTAPLVVKIAEGVVPMESATISLNPVENTDNYDLILHNFVFQNGENSIAIGNVCATVSASVLDGKLVISESTTAVVTNGDDPNVSMWIGPMIYPTIAVTIEATATTTDLEAVITMSLPGVGDVIAYFGKDTAGDTNTPEPFEYTEPMSVEIGGIMAPQGDAQLSLAIINENHADFKLKNFIFTYPDGSGQLAFGNVEVNDLEMVIDIAANCIKINAENVTANITNGDAGIVPIWMGPLMFPSLPVSLDIEASTHNIHGKVTLSVPMVGDLVVYIGEDATSAIIDASVNNGIQAIYDINGLKVNNMQRGNIYIVKMNDGTCKKVVK